VPGEHSIGRKGSLDGGRARGAGSFDGNGRLFPIREGPLKSRGSALILGKRGSKPIKKNE
jgi:hypothetical protein